MNLFCRILIYGILQNFIDKLNRGLQSIDFMYDFILHLKKFLKILCGFEKYLIFFSLYEAVSHNNSRTFGLS